MPSGGQHSGGFESTISAETRDADEAELLRIGSTLAGRYRIESTLGTGGMGRVYRARDLELGREVALKMMRRSASADARRRFRREVKLALRITHPHVVRMFDLGHSEGDDFVTMEIIEGESLRQRLARGTLPPEEAARIARQAAEGLAAAHEAGVVHRDFKPENVMFDGDRAVVVDFGVAGEDVEGQVAASAIVGTSAYMSPEQANGDAPTPQTDLYALGLVLYEMMVGVVPLVGSGPVATALRRQREKPPALRQSCAEAPRSLELLVSRLLALDPRARPSSASEVADLLDRLDEGVGDRSWTKPLLAVGLAIVFVSAAVAFALTRADDDRPRRPAAQIDANADHILAIAPSPRAQLAPELAFLRPHLRAAAFRALANALPGRVAPPSSDAPEAAAVEVIVTGKPGAIEATLRCAGVTMTGRESTLGAALDAAAAVLVQALLPDGPAESDRERALARRWGARDGQEVRAFRGVEIAFARRRARQDQAALRLARPGFVRPHMLALASLQALGPGHREAIAIARSHATTAPASERVVLEGLIGVLENSPIKARDVPHRADDPWATIARAWGAAYEDRIDDALALIHGITRAPDIAALGATNAIEVTRYYRSGSLVESADRLVRALPEEPAAWLEVAGAHAMFGNRDQANTALARARALGATGGTFDEVAAALALAALDFERTNEAARRLIARDKPEWKLEGQRVLYAVDVMTGRFARANKRLTELTELIRASKTVWSTEAAIWLGLDAFARGERQLTRALARLGVEAANAISDREYEAMANALGAANERVDGTLDGEAFAARLDQIGAALRRHGHNPSALFALRMARLLVADHSDDCVAVIAASKGYARQSPAILALARCDLEEKKPARAIARLTTMFHGVEPSTAPTLFVRRELALGRAYVMSGKPERAREHLARVIELWKHAPDRGEVARAQKLLLQTKAR